ncbi:hypothetical protein GCM10019016_089170 [Streptomyces prasinosporus]|uniref:Uncharacterized protein n=1 Tax=Streptomyces prasinosporus TaxID=68256 RepID=A0ABP6U3X3_9ACTN
MHRALVDLMRERAREVLVPERVTAEPPRPLSLAGLSAPGTDGVTGAAGPSELAAGPVDLVAPGSGFAFRLAPVAGPPAGPRPTSLDALFGFSEDEEAALGPGGRDEDRQYTGEDPVRPGTSRAAAPFAVTDDPAPAPRGRSRAEGGPRRGRGRRPSRRRGSAESGSVTLGEPARPTRTERRMAHWYCRLAW